MPLSSLIILKGTILDTPLRRKSGRLKCGWQIACCREPSWLRAPPADYQSPPPCLYWGCTFTCPFLCIEGILVLSSEPLAWGLPISLGKIFFGLHRSLTLSRQVTSPYPLFSQLFAVNGLSLPTPAPLLFTIVNIIYYPVPR